MYIHGLSQLTLLDYPGKLACTVFCGSCNFRCPFCHNASLVLNPTSLPSMSEDKVIAHLQKRKNTLEGVCITGGEPTLQPDLADFIRRIKDETGFPVKLDTNGSHPDTVERLLSEHLIDSIAMDIKSSPGGYARAAGLPSFTMDNIFRSVDLIRSSDIDYEFRTTVVDGIHSDDDFREIGKWLRGSRAYYLQMYKDSGELISPLGLKAPSREDLIRYRDILLPYIETVDIRGVDL